MPDRELVSISFVAESARWKKRARWIYGSVRHHSQTELVKIRKTHNVFYDDDAIQMQQ